MNSKNTKSKRRGCGRKSVHSAGNVKTGVLYSELKVLDSLLKSTLVDDDIVEFRRNGFLARKKYQFFYKKFVKRIPAKIISRRIGVFLATYPITVRPSTREISTQTDCLSKSSIRRQVLSLISNRSCEPGKVTSYIVQKAHNDRVVVSVCKKPIRMNFLPSASEDWFSLNALVKRSVKESRPYWPEMVLFWITNVFVDYPVEEVTSLIRSLYPNVEASNRNIKITRTSVFSWEKKRNANFLYRTTAGRYELAPAEKAPAHYSDYWGHVPRPKFLFDSSDFRVLGKDLIFNDLIGKWQPRKLSFLEKLNYSYK